jgi:hypothetical protein
MNLSRDDDECRWADFPGRVYVIQCRRPTEQPEQHWGPAEVGFPARGNLSAKETRMLALALLAAGNLAERWTRERLAEPTLSGPSP